MDILEEDFMNEFTTAEQFREAIANKMNDLRGEINAK